MGTDLRDAARQALEVLEVLAEGAEDECGEPTCNDCKAWRPVWSAITALKAALEQPERPNFTLSCGCPSQYGGVPAYWERDGSTAFGMICEKHWHEYGARSES